ncbi:MAG TPA: glycerol-3-phosphate dehydrogenase/oxidase [Limnochordales bacterium]|nr:glycerol-3-phosphate dehydrogenase/oxidase [Limnochordales bacterium]
MIVQRDHMLRQLADESFDLLIIGGGITGVGVAREAARRGLRTALVEMRDFAWGTSSRSTKLIHGGLRYLRNYEFGLVREAVVERQRLLRMAPHLVHPIPFVLPVYQGDPDPLWMLKIGLMLYDWFSGRDTPIRHRIVRGPGVARWEPLLKQESLVGGGVYMDCTTDDARLVIEVLQSAVQWGAVAANYAAVTAFRHNGAGELTAVEVQDTLGGHRFPVRARRVLSACGPWADAVRRLDDPGAAPLLRLTKGVHITVPRERLPLTNAVTMRGTDGRIMFAIPSGAFTYLGTTDTDYAGAPEDVRVEGADVDYILAAARKNFPGQRLGPDDVVSAWVGLRPLVRSNAADPSAVSRGYELFPSPSGLVTVAGGKLTAFRSMASHIVDYLFPETRRARGTAPSDAPLPGAPEEAAPAGAVAAIARTTGEPEAEVARVVERYGRRFPAMWSLWQQRTRAADPPHDERPRGSRPAGGHPSSPAGGDPLLAWRELQLRQAVEHEMAVRLEDVLARRTSLLLFSADNGQRHVEALGQIMGQLLGWSPQRVTEEVALARQRVQEMFLWKEPSLAAQR